MQSTPTKKQATSSNGLSYTTPERRRVLDPNDTRGSMALATPEELKAQLASRPRSVRSAVSQGYSFPSRAPLSATRSQPELGGSSSLYPTSPSPSSPSIVNESIIQARPQGLMPMCDTLSSPSYSPSSANNASLSYEHSTASIFANAQRIHNSYLINRSPSSSSSSSTSNSGLASHNSSPRKRGQLDDDDDDHEDEGMPMRANGLVGAKAYNNNDGMDEDEADETMMATTEQENDLPLSRSTRLSPYNNQQQQYSPSLSFGTNSGTNSASSSISSFSNGDIFSNQSSSTSPAAHLGGPTAMLGRRQLKTLPKRQGLGKTQSLPVDAFMSHMGMGVDAERGGIQLAPDIFNAQDGF